jgi:hypothetical protein
MHENGDTTVDVEAARDALEKFVMENDELLELEARIGRFNIFDALGIVNAEIKHSNFLGWLLDPAESHGAGDLFLKAVLMDMLRQTPEGLRPKKVSPIDLDGATIADVEIRREWRNIDLLIRCESPRLVIAIENKIRSGEHGGQLARYKKIVREAFPDDPSMFVFLTREGDDPSDEDWTTYSYGRIKEVLERVRRTNEGAIGEEVDTFLDHYLHLIGSRLMDDQIIDDLCRKIYKNHRQAIDLIVERALSSESIAMQIVRDIFEEQGDKWELHPSNDSRVRFGPRGWTDCFPPIGEDKSFDPRLWLRASLAEERRRGLVFRVNLTPCTDSQTREQIAQRLVENPKEFGFRPAFRNAIQQQRWVQLCAEVVLNERQLEASDEQAIRAATEKKLSEVSRRLASVMAAVREIQKK